MKKTPGKKPMVDPFQFERLDHDVADDVSWCWNWNFVVVVVVVDDSGLLRK